MYARVSPRMQPEACGLTHSRRCGSILLVGGFYKYSAPPFSFRHPIPHQSKHKTCLERDRERESGRFKSMVDSEDQYSTEKVSSVQSAILYDCEAEALSKSIRPRLSVSYMVKRRCCPERDQFDGFRSVKVLKFDTPPESPKNCPEAIEDSVRLQISPSRPVSFFMIKPRFCPSRDQFSPVQSSRPLGFGKVFSDKPAAYRHRTL